MSFKNNRRSRRLVGCLRCGNRKFHEARGLCKTCYNKVWEAKELHKYERIGFGPSRPLPRLVDLDDPKAQEAEWMRRNLDPAHI